MNQYQEAIVFLYSNLLRFNLPRNMKAPLKRALIRSFLIEASHLPVIIDDHGQIIED